MYLSLILYVSTVISSFTENLQNDHTCHIDSIESAVTIILCIQTNDFTVNPAPPPEQNHIETINHLFTQENHCTFINPSPGVSQAGVGPQTESLQRREYETVDLLSRFD